MRRRAQIVTALSFLAMLAILVAGCGVSLQEDNKTEGGTTTVANEGTSKNANSTKVPPRPTGVIRVGGATDTPPTESLLASYQETAPGTLLRVEESEEGEAFNALCEGTTDIVSSTRPLSRQEFETCRRKDVQPVQIQLASDAAVLAIHNETNVGVDCLTLGEVHEIFRAGSPITNWSQVDFISPQTESSAPPVKVTGPNANSDLFEFFSSIALGIDLPSLASVRGDYIPHAEPRGVRLQVTGGTGKRLRLAERAKGTGAILKGQLETLKGAEEAVKGAEEAVEEAEFQVKKGIRDRRTPEAKAEDRENLQKAEEKLKKVEEKLKKVEKRLPPIRRQLRLELREGRRLHSSLGTLGLFGFTYYEVWEEQLRPMEIDTRDAEARQPNCIFPSTQTVSEATYPLARQILLTTSVERLKEAEIRAFLHYMVANAEASANELGIVPLASERRDEELSWIAGESPPEVIFYPITSTPANSGNQVELESESEEQTKREEVEAEETEEGQ
jgi:phosphate transport system substrate-binding protein